MSNDICEVEYVDEEKVERIRPHLPASPKVDRLTTVFKALSDPSRLRVLLVLSKEELCVCDMARLLDVSRSNLSHQLRHLKAMGLVTLRREGKMSYYSLTDGEVMSLVNTGLALIEEAA